MRTIPVWEKIARTMVNVAVREAASKAAVKAERAERAKADAQAKHEVYGLEVRARLKGVA
mgnify:CR=1 FL=1